MNAKFRKNLIVTACSALLCIGLVGCSKKATKADDKLNDPPAEGETTATVPDGPPVVRQADETTPAQPTEAQPEEAPSEEDAFVTRSEVDTFLDRGPSYVLTVVTVEPVHGDAGFVGYQITEVTSGARAFMTPQLRVGDVVTHVNGVRLMRPEDFMQAWRSLDKVQSIRVDFSRRAEAMHAVWVVK